MAPSASNSWSLDEVVDSEFEHSEVHRGGDRAGVIITCEHASERLPAPFRWHASDERLIGTHWAFDLGAAELAREYADAIGGTAVLSRFSRLVADPNRSEDSPTLFRDHADGLPIEMNRSVTAEGRAFRLDHYYRPFHHVVDREVARSRAQVLLAMHTFTPLYEGTPRELEIGVLFDREEELADALLRGFLAAGYRTALNEPYSGRAGLVYVADRHAKTHGRRPIELEVRQDLARDPKFRHRFVEVLANMLS